MKFQSSNFLDIPVLEAPGTFIGPSTIGDYKINHSAYSAADVVRYSFFVFGYWFFDLIITGTSSNKISE